jgi:tetratricopeptide (TPR) repeat protein
MSRAHWIYVVCWVQDGKRWFEWAESWNEARLLLDAHIGDGSSEERCASVIRLCSVFLPDGTGCVGFSPRSPQHLPGAYHAIRLSPDRDPSVVAVLRRAGAIVVIAGSDDEVKQRLGRLVPAESYARAAPVAEGERRPPSRARVTVSARRTLDLIKAGPGIREHLVDLGLGELIWLAQRGRQLRRESPSSRLNQAISEAATMALAIERSSDTLNLRAAELRDAGALEESRQISLESIALCDSFEHNPYAYAGLAATLRRMGRYDDADVAAKKALKHYPNEEGLLGLRAAILRGAADARGAHLVPVG